MTIRYTLKHTFFACYAFLLVFLLSVLPSPLYAAESSIEEAFVNDGWNAIWENRTRSLEELNNESKVLRKQIPDVVRSIDKDISIAQQEFQRLLALIQTSRNMPSELVTLNGHLAGLHDELESQLDPTMQIVNLLSDRLESLEVSEKDFTVQLSKEQTALSDDFAAYLAQLKKVTSSVNYVLRRLKGILEPGNLLLERIVTLQDKIEKRLPDLWRSHYIEPSASLFDINAWTSLPNAVSNFKQGFTGRLLSELPLTRHIWIESIIRFFFIFIPVLVFARAITHKIALLQHDAVSAFHWKRIANKAWVSIGIGLALHFASWAKGGDVFRFFIVPANIFLIWGQLYLAWELRAISKTETPSRSPFRHLLYLIIASLILLFFNPPLPLLGLIWICCLAVAIFFVRRRVLPEGIPSLEINALRFESTALWLSLVVTFFGWGRLAILVYMAFVALVISIQLGVALMALIDNASAKLPKEGFSAIIGGLLLGLAAPAVLLLVAGALVLWIIAYPGGSYLLQHAVEFNIHVGAVSFDGLRILFILTAFYVTRSLISVGSAFLLGLPLRLNRFDRSMIQPMQTAYTYALWGLFGLYGLHALGVSMTNLAVVAGGLSVGIGFGLQTIVNNFISGLILIFGRTLQEGDIIDLNGNFGTVRKVSVRATTVETFDNAVIFVPNSDLVSNRLTNWTRNSLTIRRDIGVGVAYGSDVPLVQKLLLDVAKSHTRVLHAPAATVIFNDFGASTLDFILRVWVDDINVGVSTVSELRTEIERVLRENNIEISFPQMDLHLRSADGLRGIFDKTPALEQATNTIGEAPESSTMSQDSPKKAQEHDESTNNNSSTTPNKNADVAKSMSDKPSAKVKNAE